MPLPTRVEYEALVYALPQRYTDDIGSSTLRLYSTSAFTARIEGSIQFTNGLTLHIKEFLDFRVGRILDYSYTVLRGEEKVRWYDPQPHPESADLASTFPHHRHELPDIKQNRRPAPSITFDTFNLPTLIDDCIDLGKAIRPKS